MYLPNFGLLGQIQLRSWHLTSCCWDITNNKDASPEENNFSSRICICICTKSELGAKLMAKVQLSFTSKLLFPSSQLQGALLIFETFLSSFSSVFWSFLSTFARIFPTQYHRDVQNEAQERWAHIIRSSGFQRTIQLKRIGKILNRKWPYGCMKLDHLTLTVNCDFASSKHNSSH